MTRPSRSGPGHPGDGALLLVMVAALGGAAWFWSVSEVAAWVTTGRWPHLPVAGVVGAFGRLMHHPAQPLQAWAGAVAPAPGRAATGRAATGGVATSGGVTGWVATGGVATGWVAPTAFYGAALLSAAALALASVVAVGATASPGVGARTRPGPGGRVIRRGRMATGRYPSGARWAGGADLRPLAVRRRDRSPRLVLGRPAGGGRRRLLATEARHSVLVIGPTQSGKTTGLAIPAILEWPGPVVATSVKDDLVAATARWRSSQGPCWVFDPTCSTGASRSPEDPDWDRGSLRARWSPLSGCATWAGAQRMAAWLVESTPGRRAMADAAFWYTTAGKQLAPLLLAAHRSALTMADVVRWTDAQDFAEPTRILELSGDGDAALALAACAERDERIRSSVSTTLETVLAPFADPVVALATGGTDLSMADLLSGRGTLYLCGPTHEQNRVQGLFAALVSTVVAHAVAEASATGRGLDPPLLLVLDEAANIAPIRDLDTLASTGAGLGIQLVTVCQDLAQLAARYDPERARTIANNHRAKLLLSGVADLQTLDLISGLAGERVVREHTVTDDLRAGGRTRTESPAIRRLAPADELRRVEPGHGVLVYGHLPPVRIRLRPWFAEARLRRRAAGP